MFKHFKIKFSFLREAQRKDKVKLLYYRTKDQRADILTKVLPKVKYEPLRNELGEAKRRFVESVFILIQLFGFFNC